MNIASFSIKHRVTTIMAYIMVAVFGVMGFSSLPLAMMPDIEMPMAVIFATYPGAGPEEIESLVTKPLESAAASVAGMDEIQSQSSENMSMIMVTFSDGTDMDEALVSLREKIDQVKSSLPEDTTAPTIMKIDIDAMPVMSIGLRGADLAQLQQIAEDDITPVMERIEGVASVDIMGGFDQEVAIYTKTDKMNGYGLSISYISQILVAENIAIPAGDIHNGSQKIAVRTTGEFSSVDDIANVILPLPTGGTVRLGEVADVYVQPTEQDTVAKLGTEPGVVLSVNKQSDVNTVQVANRITEQLDQITEENPTLDWVVLFDQSDYINQSVDSVVENIVLGIGLTALVLLLFLRDLGATTVIALSMPVCTISVFLVMNALGITMNVMSLGGLSVGIGMIVDNSITVLENIYRYRSEGFSRWDSCTKGTEEVWLSVMAGTLTTVAVFLPIGLAGGMAGMMFREFCITISALMAASMAIALTLVPLLCYMLLDRNPGKSRLIKSQSNELTNLPAMKKYESLLKYFITHRKVSMLISVGLVIVFSVSIGLAGFEMMPETDQGQITVAVEMPVGAELEEAAEVCDRIVAIAQDTIPEMEDSYYTSSSSISLMSDGTSVVIDIGSKADRDRNVKEIVGELRENLSDIAGCELTVSGSGSMDMSSMTGSAISVTLRGDDYTLLTDTGDLLVDQISALPDAVDVASSASEQTPQVDITLNRTTAARFGLNAATVGQAVRSTLTGASATDLKVNGEEITVSVKGDSRAADSLDALRAVPIATPAGGSIPLGAVADVSVVLAPQQIIRQNQSRTITITGDSKSDDSVTINQSVNEILTDFTLPDGITIETGGEMEEMMDSFTELGKAALAGLALIYFVLASQFESFLMPVVIMMVLPVSLIGSLFGLPLLGQKISIVAFIGVIILIGTAVGASIVLVDYINIRRERGEDKNTAILNACPRRVRPVLITSISAVIGMIPMVMSNGEGSEMMFPMAVVMITGMIVSTIVTLLFTPVYYSVLDSISERFRSKKKDDGNDADSSAEPPEPPKEDPAHV